MAPPGREAGLKTREAKAKAPDSCPGPFPFIGSDCVSAAGQQLHHSHGLVIVDPAASLWIA